jgi:hypothetical protein
MGIWRQLTRLRTQLELQITSGLPTILEVDGDKRAYEDSTHLLSLAKSR